MNRRPSLAARVEALLARHWWRPQPSLLATGLRPVAWLYGALARWQRSRTVVQPGLRVPLLVVGNCIAGGAGKTPAVIALVQAFRAAGRKPGVISRGHGRRDNAARDVALGDDPQAVGDEPLLIRRRTGVPVWVGRDRSAAARGLCAAHPEVDVLLADDGLQHVALARAAELIVVDERGVGNGLLLPAGPLRQPLPTHLAAHRRVLYTDGHASTPLPGALARRTVSQAWPLGAWLAGDSAQARPLAALRGQPLLAAAGLAAPDKFFAMLQRAGLSFEPLPLPDHEPYRDLPWPADTADVITTEKDAVKLAPQRLGRTRVWVVPLDLALPAGLANDLLALLPVPMPVRASLP